MPMEAQVRLLRVLQHKEIERVGGTDRIPVDIRIIAATNKNLGAMVERHIRKILSMTDGKIHGTGGAGELLGINPNTLRSKMKRLGIPFPKSRAG